MSMLPEASFRKLPEATSAFMSRSTAAGFCLGGAQAANDAAMVQSQIIDEMLETSHAAKTSRPDTLRTQQMYVAPPAMPQAAFSASQNPAMFMSMIPMAQSLMTPDFTPVRRQLDEMTRRSLPPSRLPTLPSVPELGSPNCQHEENLMTQSRLFQQFSAGQKGWYAHNFFIGDTKKYKNCSY
ncbi:unnamed protein product [Caenorhabditis angaria]|uniref:Uncharacterized protein n=1 Tax=Caenorhabditis angaria TaxID=860376 RepID=A0A9P1IB20_9PELO|nr:unnamed protein product [Caenorhabditis angaria]